MHTEQDEMNTDQYEASAAQREKAAEQVGEVGGGNQGRGVSSKRFRTGGVVLLLVFSMLLGAVGGSISTRVLLASMNLTGENEESEKLSPPALNGGLSLETNEATGNCGSSSYGNGVLNVAQVNEKVADTIVAIKTSMQMQSNSYGGFYVTSGAGSGVILSADGYIITNHHVIDSATEIEVTLNNGHVYPATVIDGDPATDIAILKIIPDEILHVAEIGSSDTLVVGEEVVAIGNPLGTLPGTVTNGVVSALNRVLEVNGYRRTLIQTNTEINPGNSGGGLFDLDGKLVGIVNAKQSQEGVEGLGFAIPIDTVLNLIVEIIENGYIHGRACLDLEIQEITSTSEAYYLYYNQSVGVYITSSNYGEGVDLMKGDRVVMINGMQVAKRSDLNRILATMKPGDTVTLTVGRMEIVSSGYWVQYREVGIEVTITLKEYIPDSSITFE